MNAPLEARQLRRSRSDRTLAGVCGGLAAYFEIHPAVFRVAFVVLTLLGGAGVLIYLAAAAVMPAEGRVDSFATATLRDVRDRRWPLVGLALVAVGGAAALSRLALWPGGDAVGAILVVAIAVAGSLTVLPATLGWLRGRVERGRVPLVSRRRDGDSRVWGGIVDRVLRRPAVSAVLASGLLVLLAVPALGMKTAESSIHDLPRSLPIMQTYDRIQESFPGGPLPAVVAIDAGDVAAPAVRDGIARLRAEAVATGLMAEPITVQSRPNGRVALVSIPLAGTGTDETSLRALEALREEVIPATVGSLAGGGGGAARPNAGSGEFPRPLG